MEGLLLHGPIEPAGTARYSQLLSRVGRLSSAPLAVAVPSGVRDVVALLSWVRATGLGFSVMNGGLNPSHQCCAGRLVVATDALRFVVRLDEISERVVVGAGCLMEDVDRELSVLGRCLPGPVYERVGLAGALLGGGWGYLSKRHGLLCDAAEAMEVVTAAGDVLRISGGAHDPHRELFWALTRGGGAGTLCFVTSITFLTLPAPPAVCHGLITGLPLSHARRVAEAVRLLKPTWDADTVVYPVVERRAGISLVFFCAKGMEAARGPMEALVRELACPSLRNGVTEKSYWEAQRALSSWFEPPSGEGCDSMSQHGSFVDNLHVEDFCKVVARVEQHSGFIRVAYQNYFEDTGYLVVASAHWRSGQDPDLTEECRSLVQAAVQDHELGSAPNFVGNASLEALFNRRDARRLLAVKKAYDPHNLFQHHVINF